jgi:uncharacterized protein
MAAGTETTPHTYPHGVPCWIETAQPDPALASAFYAELLGWTVEPAPGSGGEYLIASLDGRPAAAITRGASVGDAGDAGRAEWLTYIAVDDADSAAAAFAEAGAEVLEGPVDAGPAGRFAVVRDPDGAEFRVWQAGRRLGSQVNNLPGAWNFSDLHAADPQRALAPYRRVLGWQVEDMGPDAEAIIRVPGYGDHLESTVDPDIRTRQAGAPEGFADAIGAVVPARDGEPPHWHVTISVADRDASAATAERLGAVVLDRRDGHWARTARIRDPQGAELTLSEFVAPV